MLGHKHKLFNLRSKALWTASDYPDVLEVFAVDRIQNTLGSYELHRTLDVNVSHDPTLVILNTAEAGEAAAHSQARVQVTRRNATYAGVVPTDDVPDHDGPVFKIELKKEQTSSNTTSASTIDGAKIHGFCVVSTIRPNQGCLGCSLMESDSTRASMQQLLTGCHD